MKGTEFANQLLKIESDTFKNPHAPTSQEVEQVLELRARAVLAAIDDGALVPPTWTPIDVIESGHTVRVFVSDDALAIGEPGDLLRFEVTPILAQQICDRFAWSLSTPKIEDLAWKAAAVRIEPQLMPASSAMSLSLMQIEYGARVDAAVKKAGGQYGQLVRTVGKQWVLCGALDRHPMGDAGAVNHGFHTRFAPTPSGPYASRECPGLVLWQDVGTRHNVHHCDESQILCPVLGIAVVDGESMAFADLLRDQALARLVSYDGALVNVRQRGVPLEKAP